MVVDTTLLKRKANQIGDLSRRLDGISDEIRTLDKVISPGSYDGQPYDWVRSIVGDASEQVNRISQLLLSSGSRLTSKVREFEEANTSVYREIGFIASLFVKAKDVMYRLLGRGKDRENLLAPNARDQTNKASAEPYWRSSIKEDGPTPSNPFSPITIGNPTQNGNCTYYVATRRDVSGFYVPGEMDAKNWARHAENHGYLVNATPRKGAIIVFEVDSGGVIPGQLWARIPGVYYGRGSSNFEADADNGHVAYVESVDFDEEGNMFFLTIKHQGVTPSPGLDHQESTITLYPEELLGVRFIHGKN